MPTVDVDGRPALRLERAIALPAERVWPALTEPARLGRWYPFPVAELQPRVGGRLAFDYQGKAIEATITDFEAPRVFAFDEHDLAGHEREFDDHVVMELGPGDAAGSCVLVFTHIPSDPSGTEGVLAGWEKCLDRLVAEVGGGGAAGKTAGAAAAGAPPAKPAPKPTPKPAPKPGPKPGP
ncbi:MAG: hypothetical protein HOV68_07215 [Streptomycetaceae bacterium]|nr:hypothetical protein [Streptomycetaceae bacterium]